MMDAMRQEKPERTDTSTSLKVVTKGKWSLELHQALARDVVSLITSDTPSLKKVALWLKRTHLWKRVFNAPFESPTVWADMHPPLVLEMLEAAGKMGKVCTVEQALTELANTGVWQQCSFDELESRYNHYTQKRVSIFYTPYSDKLTERHPTPEATSVCEPLLRRRA
jgi:hypothetical protein